MAQVSGAAAQRLQIAEQALDLGVKILGLRGRDQPALDPLEQLEAEFVLGVQQDLAEYDFVDVQAWAR